MLSWEDTVLLDAGMQAHKQTATESTAIEAELKSIERWTCKCAKRLCVTQIRNRRVTKFYLIMLRTAVRHLSRVGSVSVHQAQKPCCMFAQKFKLSSLTEEIKGKEGQEHFQVDLMKRHYPRWAGNHSSTHSAPSSFIRRPAQRTNRK